MNISRPDFNREPQNIDPTKSSPPTRDKTPHQSLLPRIQGPCTNVNNDNPLTCKATHRLSPIRSHPPFLIGGEEVHSIILENKITPMHKINPAIFSKIEPHLIEFIIFNELEKTLKIIRGANSETPIPESSFSRSDINHTLEIFHKGQYITATVSETQNCSAEDFKRLIDELRIHINNTTELSANEIKQQKLDKTTLEIAISNNLAIPSNTALPKAQSKKSTKFISDSKKHSLHSSTNRGLNIKENLENKRREDEIYRINDKKAKKNKTIWTEELQKKESTKETNHQIIRELEK